MNEPSPTGLIPTENRLNLNSPEAPLILYQSLKENVSLGKNLNPDKFLDDLSGLRLTGAIEKQPLLQTKLVEWGQDPQLLLAVYLRTRESVNSDDPNQAIKDNLALAHLLGMDRKSADPRKQLAIDQIRKWQEIYKVLPKTEAKKRPSLRTRLVLTAAAAGSLGLAFATPGIPGVVSMEPSESAKTPAKVVTLGTLTSTNEQVEVLRPTGTGRFLVQTSAGQQFEIPIDSVEIQGNLSWEKEVKRVDWLGFDCADPNLVDKIPQIGAGIIRIPVEQATKEFFDNNPWVIQAINKAKDNNLTITLLFNPTELISQSETSKRIDTMLSLVNGYSKVQFELGNEADTAEFWNGGDLNSYAKFVKQASDILRQRRPDAKMIIGAMGTINEGSPVELVKQLTNANVDMSQLIFSVHGYQDVNQLKSRIKELKQAVGENVRFVVTELGVNQSEKAKTELLPQMIKTAKDAGAQEVIVFQLRDIEFQGGDGRWGVVTPDGQWEKPVWPLVDLAWRESHK